MDALQALTSRNSHGALGEPGPDPAALEKILAAALRAPDHAWLRPWRFILVSGEGRARLADCLLRVARELQGELAPGEERKLRDAPFRAPMVVVLVARIREHPKVPPVEQIVSTALAGQNMLLAAHALGYGGIWRTGKFAYNDAIRRALELPEGDQVIGYLYLGTALGQAKALPRLDPADFVTHWD